MGSEGDFSLVPDFDRFCSYRLIHNQGEGVTSSTGEYEHYPLSITRVPWSKWGLKGGISI